MENWAIGHASSPRNMQTLSYTEWVMFPPVFLSPPCVLFIYYYGWYDAADDYYYCYYYFPFQNVGWNIPHGHSLQARCKDLGLYKLLGETRVLCSNGLWAPRMPSCVQTTLLTNFSGKIPLLIMSIMTIYQMSATISFNSLHSQWRN